MLQKTLFIDRDGVLIQEPLDQQIDSLEKLELLPFVISSLKKLKDNGFALVMVSNQDGLGTASFPQKHFDAPHNKLLTQLKNEGVEFDKIFICPHFKADNCECRKPKIALLDSYLKERTIDPKNSYVIGDRTTDMQLAKNLGVQGIFLQDASQIQEKGFSQEINEDTIAPSLRVYTGWKDIVSFLLERKAEVVRKTSETDICIKVNLDGTGVYSIRTGLGFFDHMLEQIAKHSGIDITLECKGDLHIDQHHTIEDTGLELGECILKALGEKRGIQRYGFVMPMDESQAQVALDFSGRAYTVFEVEFKREMLGEMPTEMIPHFFRSFADSLKATLHVTCKGENDHHKAEACFKSLAQVLRQAVSRRENSTDIPSSKGVL